LWHSKTTGAAVILNSGFEVYKTGQMLVNLPLHCCTDTTTNIAAMMSTTRATPPITGPR